MKNLNYLGKKVMTFIGVMIIAFASTCSNVVANPVQQINLTTLFENEGAWNSYFNETQIQIKALEGYKGTLKDKVTLLQCLKLNDEIAIALGKLGAYPRLQGSINQKDTNCTKMTNKVNNLYKEYNKANAAVAATFVEKFNEKQINALMEDKAFKPYIRLIYDLCVLGEGDETPDFVDEVGSILEETSDIYTKILYADTYNDCGEESTYNQILEDRKYSLSALFNMEAQTHVAYAKYWGYDSVMDYLLERQNVDRETYVNLKTQVRSQIPVLREYLKLKRELLNEEKLDVNVLYGSLLENGITEMSYDEAIHIVKEAYKIFPEEYSQIADRAFKEQWIDSLPAPNKADDAYCLQIQGSHPFIITNFYNNLTDTTTIAHELGHAVHFIMAEKGQPYRSSTPDIFTSEIASTVAEGSVARYLLKEAKDKETYLEVLDQQIDALMNTYFYQTMLAEFEERSYIFVEKGGTLTPDKLEEIWGELLKEYYGSDYTITEGETMSWASVPHIFFDFYTFQYVSSYVTSQVVLDQITSGDANIEKNWMNFLKAGGSDMPVELTKKYLGVDLKTKAPYMHIETLFKRYMQDMKEVLTKN